MANHHEVDKSTEFMDSGMTLISEISSEKYLNQARKNKYNVPNDRYSRPCGGPGGFDDYVERWHE